MAKHLNRGLCPHCDVWLESNTSITFPPGSGVSVCVACYRESVGAPVEDMKALRREIAAAGEKWSCQKMGVEDYHRSQGPLSPRGKRRYM